MWRSATAAFVLIAASTLSPVALAQRPTAVIADLTGEWICQVHCPAGGVGNTARIVQTGRTLQLTNEGGMKSDGVIQPDSTSIVATQWGNVSARISADGKRLEWTNGTIWTRSFAKVLEATGRVDIYGIHFDLDKAEIRPDSRPALEEVAELLKKDPALKLEVAGHTDNTGTTAHNLDLSRRRATAVMNALVKDYGIAAARLRATGYGDTKPVASNDSEANRASNRRVELRRMSPATSPRAGRN